MKPISLLPKRSARAPATGRAKALVTSARVEPSAIWPRDQPSAASMGLTK